MKKINITTIALLVYLIVMSIIGWPGNNPGNNYTEYFLMIGATLVIIILSASQALENAGQVE